MMKPALNTEELLLVYRFRKLDKKTQSCVKSFMRGLLETEPKRKKVAPALENRDD